MKSYVSSCHHSHLMMMLKLFVFKNKNKKEVSTWCPLSLHDHDLAGLRRPLRERDDNRQRVCTYNIREKGLALSPSRSIFFLFSFKYCPTLHHRHKEKRLSASLKLLEGDWKMVALFHQKMKNNNNNNKKVPASRRSNEPIAPTQPQPHTHTRIIKTLKVRSCPKRIRESTSFSLQKIFPKR